MDPVLKLCCVCSENVSDIFRRLPCALCDNLTHSRCIPQSFTDEEIIRYNHPQSPIKYICPTCDLMLKRKEELVRLDHTIHELRNQLSRIYGEYNELQLKHDEAASHIAAIELTRMNTKLESSPKLGYSNQTYNLDAASVTTFRRNYSKFSKQYVVLQNIAKNGTSPYDYREVLVNGINRSLTDIETYRINWKHKRKLHTW